MCEEKHSGSVPTFRTRRLSDSVLAVIARRSELRESHLRQLMHFLGEECLSRKTLEVFESGYNHRYVRVPTWTEVERLTREDAGGTEAHEEVPHERPGRQSTGNEHGSDHVGGQAP